MMPDDDDIPRVLHGRISFICPSGKEISNSLVITEALIQSCRLDLQDQLIIFASDAIKAMVPLLLTEFMDTEEKPK